VPGFNAAAVYSQIWKIHGKLTMRYNCIARPGKQVLSPRKCDGVLSFSYGNGYQGDYINWKVVFVKTER